MMPNLNALNIITAQARVPHFYEDFPLILFLAKKRMHFLALWFLSNKFTNETALEGCEDSEYIHNYEFSIYKSDVTYQDKLINNLQNKQTNAYKLVRDPYKKL